MSEEIPGVISHVSIGTNDLDRSLKFYDSVLPAVRCERKEEVPGAVAYGYKFPEFWVGKPLDGQPATVGNGSHFSFIALSKEDVHAFYEAAIKAGGICDGKPGPRPEYGEPYYGCFIRDPDGHKIEAAFWDFSLAGD